MRRLIAFIGRRKRTAILLAVAMLLLLGPYVLSRARSAGRCIRIRSVAAEPATTKAPTLRVATYNIAHGRGCSDDNWRQSSAGKRQRIDEIATLLRQTQADIVVLNEVDFCSTWSGHFNQAEAFARAAGFPYWVEQRNFDFRFLYGSWKFGNAIFSKYPIIDCRVVDFPAYSAWEKHLVGCKRGALCTIQLAPERQIRVLGVHLDDRDEDVRAAAAQMIVDLTAASDVPLLAAGDFNSTPRGFPRCESGPTGANAIDLLTRSTKFNRRPETSPGAHELTFPADRPATVIDWILIPKPWSFTEYRVLSPQLSDHRPVVATVRAGP